MQIRRQDYDDICAQAASEYPAECCGVLTAGPEGGASRVHRCRNIQDRLHADDPLQFPRQARSAYYIDPQELYGIIAAVEQGGGCVSGFYHSHIECDAYFSTEDRDRALLWDEPAYAGAVYLVLSVYDARVQAHSCFAWDEDMRDFARAELELIS